MMEATPPSPAEPARGRTGVGRLTLDTRSSFVLVVLALVLLLVLPLLVRQRSDAIRRAATDISEPARDLAETVERDMAVQAADARGFLLTRDPRLLTEYEAAGLEAQAALQKMRPLAAELSPRAVSALEQMRVSLAAWQVSTRGFLTAPPSPASDAAHVVADQPLFQAMIRAAAAFDDAIDAAIEPRRLEARRIDDAAILITAILVVLVLASVLVLLRLASQLRALAEEARVRAQLEASLRGEVERSVEARARLIRGFSHDVRNPLGAADGYAQLLQEGIFGELEPRQHESLERMRKAIAAAVLLTDDLLDLARLEAGQLKPAAEPIELRTIAAEVADEYRAQAESAGLQLDLRLPPQPVPVLSDGRRIRQILANLLSNAIKYTAEGGRLGVALVEGAPGQAAEPLLGLQVSDTGIGIDPQARARIFDEFARLDPASTQGAGLGLAISRRLAWALGGDITLQSEPGAGSTFTLWIPRREPPTSG